MAKRPASRKVGGSDVEEAQFVFRGTVVQPAASNLPEVTAERDTAIVRVEEVLHGDALDGYAGESVTVKLGSGQRVSEGGEYVIHANGWIYGANLAVVAVGIESAGAANTARARVAERPAARLKKRADRAELVVSGQVTSVQPVPPQSGDPITEHNPEWHDATVHVESVAKGKPTGRAAKEVTIRFAGSMDHRWAQAPKFSAGTEGVWMLGDKSKEGKAMRTSLAVPPTHYLVVSPEDFHPKERAAEVLSAIR